MFGVVQLRSFKLLVETLYLTSGHGLKADNLGKLIRLTSLVKLMRLSFIVVADWNVEPGELEGAGWVEKLGGAVVRLPASVTCTGSREHDRLHGCQP